MSHIQFGWTAPQVDLDFPQQAFRDTMQAVLDTIVGHFDSVWVGDHVQIGQHSVLEGWTLLTYLAAMRPELRYGHVVLCQLFRNPALLAKMAATFQFVSHGNFILGLGAGWMEEEARAYHLPFPPAGQRVSEFEEQLQIITALWRKDNVTFAGQYHQVTNAYCLPRPEPIPPMVIAGFQPRMMRLVARYADWWNTATDTLAMASEQSKALDAACEHMGRDPQTLRRTAQVRCYCAPTEQKLKELTANSMKQPFCIDVIGTPAQVVEQFQSIIEVGFDYFMIGAGDSWHDLTTLELLAHEVLPALNRGRVPGNDHA